MCFYESLFPEIAFKFTFYLYKETNAHKHVFNKHLKAFHGLFNYFFNTISAVPEKLDKLKFLLLVNMTEKHFYAIRMEENLSSLHDQSFSKSFL